LIKAENLTKIYENGFKAVNNLDLSIDKGDIFGFLGPNGSGKTTTIRMLNGLYKPTSGKIFINGIDLSKDPTEVKKIIGVLPELHGYYRWMTGEEYLMYFGRLYKQNEKELKNHVRELIESVGLSEKSHFKIGNFSTGMKQRLGIAKTLINNPKIIFLDEPTLGLDPSGQREIQKLILDLNKKRNVTVFITSHLLKDIEVLCNKVAIFQNGVMLEQGGIKELLNKYSNDSGKVTIEDIFFRLTERNLEVV